MSVTTARGQSVLTQGRRGRGCSRLPGSAGALLTIILLWVLACMPAPATAQDLEQPPVVNAMDANGVNLATGKFQLPGLNIAIGGSGSGLGRVTQGDADNYSGLIKVDSSGNACYMGGCTGGLALYVSYAGQTNGTAFGYYGSGGTTTYPGPYKFSHGITLTCTPATTLASPCTLNLPDGTSVNYSSSATPTAGAMSAISATKPDGEILSFTYYMSGGYARSIKSVTSSLGWMLWYDVDVNYKVVKVTALNQSAYYCDPNGSSCTPGGDSPYVSSTTSGSTTTISRNGTALVSYSVSGATTTTTSPSGVAKAVTTYSSGTYAGRVSTVNIGGIGGSTWSYAYAVDANGNTVTTVTAPNGTTRSLAVANGHQIVYQTDEDGRITKYAYSGVGSDQITEVVNPDGNAATGGFTLYQYDPTGRVTQTSVVPKNGAAGGTPNPGAALISTATYVACDGTNASSCMKPRSHTDVTGATTTYTYDASGNLLSTIAPAATSGAYQLATFNTYAAKTPQIKTSGGTLASNPAVKRLSVTKTCEVIAATSTACDVTGGQWTETDINYDVDSGYTGAGRNLLPVSVIAKRSDKTATLETDSLYNNLGQVIYSYGPKASDDSDTDLTSKETFTFYDAVNRPVGTIGPDPDGTASTMKRQASRTTYDSDGQVTMQETGLVPTSAYAGASLNAKWLAAQTEFNSTTAGITVLEKNTNEYSPSSATQPGMPVRARHYAALGVTGSTLEDSVTERLYDNMFRPSCEAERLLAPSDLHALTAAVPYPDACHQSITPGADGADRITQYSYDNLGQVLTTKSGVGTSSPRTDVTNIYGNGTLTDPAGNIIPVGMAASATDAKVNKTAYGYDNFDRLVETWYPSKTTPGSISTTDYQTTTYTGARISSQTLRDGQTVNFAYDNLGHVTGTTGASVEASTFDTFGRVLTHDNTTTGGAVAHAIYGYDAVGALMSAQSQLGIATNRTVSYLYDSYGRRTRLTWPDSFYVNYVYYAGGAPHYIRDNAGIYILRDEYDAYDRPFDKKLGNSGPYPVLTSYTYDASMRISGMTNNLGGPSGATDLDATYGFTYTLGDDIKTRSVTTAVYDFNPAPPAVVTPVNGLNQIASYNATAFSYDGRGNLTSTGGVTYTYNNKNLLTSVVDTLGTATLTYDAEDRLATIDRSGGASTTFLYDSDDMIAEYDTSTGSMVNRYVHGFGADEPVVSYAGSGTADTDRRYLVSDAQGSIVAVVSSVGTFFKADGITPVVGTHINAYDEYGVPKSGVDGNVGRFQYTGQMYLAEIGMYYYKARIYAPTLGRFLQPDPIGYSDGMNMYAYVHSNPVNSTDPSGLCPGCTGNWDGDQGGQTQDEGTVVYVPAPDNYFANLDRYSDMQEQYGQFNSSIVRSVDTPEDSTLVIVVGQKKFDCKNGYGPDGAPCISGKVSKCRQYVNNSTCYIYRTDVCPQGMTCIVVTTPEEQQLENDYDQCVADLDTGRDDTNDVLDGTNSVHSTVDPVGSIPGYVGQVFGKIIDRHSRADLIRKKCGEPR